MKSSFNWVDFAEEDRQRVMEVLHIFQKSDIREELGVGTVRDAFSDILFPGTSTLHTRAKYMLFIPWIFLNRERRKTTSDKIAEFSRWDEINLIHALLASGEEEGVIGRIAKDKLKILPSYMYWSGLGRWGIRQVDGPPYQYFRYLDNYYYSQKNIVKSDDNELSSNLSYNWDPQIVEPPKDFPKNVTLVLSYAEAAYLHDKIKANCRDSLLAFLIDETIPVKVKYIWWHPQTGEFSKEHKKIIWHARNFSETIYGASLLYNLMLSEKKGNQEWIEKYKNMIKIWSDEIKERFYDIENWNLAEFWQIVLDDNRHIPNSTKRFIENWIYLVKESKDLAKISKYEPVRNLIYRREVRIKGKRARLKNPEMLAQWTGAAGAYKLSYRWGIGQQFVNDILKGLKRNK
jgi:hypothetical protein